MRPRLLWSAEGVGGLAVPASEQRGFGRLPLGHADNARLVASSSGRGNGGGRRLVRLPVLRVGEAARRPREQTAAATAAATARPRLEGR